MRYEMRGMFRINLHPVVNGHPETPREANSTYVALPVNHSTMTLFGNLRTGVRI